MPPACCEKQQAPAAQQVRVDNRRKHEQQQGAAPDIGYEIDWPLHPWRSNVVRLTDDFATAWRCPWAKGP